MPQNTGDERIRRLNGLVAELQRGGQEGVSSKDLMAAGGFASRRTLERDLEFLRDRLGLRTTFVSSRRRGDPGRYVVTDPGGYVLHCRLGPGGVTGLRAGLSLAAHFLPHLAGELEEVWAKLRPSLPEGEAALGEALARASVVSLPVSDLDPKVFAAVVEALRRRRVLQIRYLSPYEGETVPRIRRVSPWGVFFQGHAWYLWGSHPKVAAGASYRVSRIRDAVEVGTPYEEAPEAWSLQDHASSGWHGFAGRNLRPVAVRVLPPLASVVQETRWHPTQRIQEHPQGGILLTARVPDLKAVARWILASAPFAWALEPEELGREVASLARGTLARQEEGLGG